MARPRGHAVEVTPGSWQLRVTLPADVDGRRAKVTRTFKSSQPRPRSGGYPRDVVRALAGLVAETDEVVTPAASRTYAQLADEWLAIANIEEQTRYGYEGYLRRHILPTFGHRKVSSITVADLDKFYASFRDSHAPRTIRQIHVLMRRSLQFALKWGWIPYNPASMTSPEFKGGLSAVDVDAPSLDEVRALLSAIEEREPMLNLFLTTSAALGTRRGETLALRWCDLDVAASTLRVERSIYQIPRQAIRVKGTKTGANATLAIPAELTAKLSSRHEGAIERAAMHGVALSENAYIFTSDVAGMCPWQPAYATHRVGILRDELGLPKRLTIKNLRHFHATQLLAAGVDLGTVAGRLRHTDKSTTLKFYSKLDETADRKAADVWGQIL